MNILIVDDDPVSRALLKAILNKMHHEVIEAKNGHEAWELIRNNNIRLLITDWVMPQMDGLELCRKIREQLLESYVYIIILTGKGDKNHLIEGLEAGAGVLVRHRNHVIAPDTRQLPPGCPGRRDVGHPCHRTVS